MGNDSGLKVRVFLGAVALLFAFGVGIAYGHLYPVTDVTRDKHFWNLIATGFVSLLSYVIMVGLGGDN